MIVMKFGGSSLANAERIKHVAGIIRENLKHKPVLVLSATGDTTDELLEAGRLALTGRMVGEEIIGRHTLIAQELGVELNVFGELSADLHDLLRGISLLKELSPRSKDYLVSFGERLSVRLVAAYLSKLGIPAKPLDAWEVGFTTDSKFGSAELSSASFIEAHNRLAILDREYTFTPVVTGFIAMDSDRNITTLGRGGSDLTACALGAALMAIEVQVWKDVDGILTANPKYVPEALPVPIISFEEASELAYFGANVLHPRALIPAMQRGVPVRVKNSYNPTHPGTIIHIQQGIHNQQGAGLVKAITCKRELTLVDIVSLRMLGQQGFLARLFQIFEKHAVSVDMVATSEVSVSLTLDDGGDLEGLRAELSEFSKVEITQSKASISLIGDVRHSTQLLQDAFATMKAVNVNIQMVSHGASKVQFGFIVNDNEAEKCVRALHSRFFPAASLPQLLDSSS